MRRTNRSNRAKQKQRNTVQVLLALLLGIAAVYFAFATAAGQFIAEQVIAPVFRRLAHGDTQQEIYALSPDPDAVYTLPTTEIIVEEKVFYALSAGAFAKKSNADELAAEVKARAGGGYIYDDGSLYRVLIAIYPDESSARSVKEQLLSVNGAEASLYQLAVPRLTLRVTADQEYLSAVREGFSALAQTCDEMYALSAAYDEGKLTQTEVCEKIKALSELCHAPAAALKGANSGTAGTLCATLEETSEKLSGFVANNTENSLAFSAVLKYNQIKVICTYTDFIRSVADL